MVECVSFTKKKGGRFFFFDPQEKTYKKRENYRENLTNREKNKSVLCETGREPLPQKYDEGSLNDGRGGAMDVICFSLSSTSRDASCYPSP